MHCSMNAVQYRSWYKNGSTLCSVHGDVSQEPARWTAHPSLQGQALKEVAYAKAEGVAKVRVGCSWSYNHRLCASMSISSQYAAGHHQSTSQTQRFHSFDR